MGWWQQRTPSERRMLLLCLVVVVIGGWMLMTPTEGSTKKLLTTAEASQKYEKAFAEKNRKEAEIERLSPEITRLTYKEAPEQIIPRVIKDLQETARGSGIHIREIK